MHLEEEERRIYINLSNQEKLAEQEEAAARQVSACLRFMSVHMAFQYTGSCSPSCIHAGARLSCHWSWRDVTLATYQHIASTFTAVLKVL